MRQLEKTYVQDDMRLDVYDDDQLVLKVGMAAVPLDLKQFKQLRKFLRKCAWK